MRIRTGLVVAALALFLAGCEEVDIDPFDDSDAPAAAASSPAYPGAPHPAAACTTENGCPQASQFCMARGYQPNTDGFSRCLVSVEQNLRNGQ
jgi:hypothetical protein